MSAIALGKPLRGLLHRPDGPLTEELLREPAAFGLGQLPARSLPHAATTMVCGFCSTGCGLRIHLRDAKGIGVSPDAAYPVNLGMACPKGWEALRVLDADDRGTVPLLRERGGRARPITWREAIDTFVTRVQSIQARFGPESVAFLSTGQIPTEEMAFLGALAKFGMGIKHGDGNTRQCMASAVVAYKESFGFDAAPYAYADFEESDVIVLVGSNLCLAHPILWQRVCRNRRQPEIIVVDPRRTETAMAATLHLPIRPKSDLVLFYSVARLLIERGWIDRGYIDAHTEDFEAFAAHVLSYSLEQAAEVTGLAPQSIERFADLVHRGQRVSFWWTMGVNQSYEGVSVAQSLINLSLMTGNIGRPGTGANSITGQCNAMGSRLFSNTTNLLGGHDFANSRHRAKVARILGIDARHIPDRASWAYDQILEGILAGKIRGLWVIGTNGAHSWINQGQFHDIVGRLDFLAVQDMYTTTETAQIADLFLPSAGWGEKDGTFINSERRVGLIQKVRSAPGEALSDFNIFRLIAHRWGLAKTFARWTSPEAVFAILQELSEGQPCDITGIDGYRMLAEQGGVQWPYPKCASPSGAERRLFEDGRFYRPNGRAKFCFRTPRSMPEPPCDAYPFLLLTGRGSAAQWHTQTRTSKSPILRKLYPAEIFVQINPKDARRLGVPPESRVIVESRRGQLTARAVLTHSVQPGQVFLPMHYVETNRLTDAVFDPDSRQPSYKACAVRILKCQQERYR